MTTHKRSRCLIAAVAVALCICSAAHAEIILRRGIRYEPASLDPHKYNTRYEAAIIADLFEGLVAFDAEGKPRPGLASAWTSSSDARVWTFTLRPNLAWSDGVPLTADDVVFSLRRLMDPRTAANYAPLLYVLKNGRPVNAGALPVEALGVAATAPGTVTLTLESPTLYLPELLANAFVAVIPKHTVAAWGDGWIRAGHAVSDGAFMLLEWTPQNRIVLARNPHYHGNGDLKLDGIIYYPSADIEAAVARFRAGELDMQSDFPSGRLDLLRAQLPDQVHVAPALETFYLALNGAVPKLADARVRMALSLAIDRDLFAAKVLRDGALPAHSLVPPTVTDYRPATMDFLAAPMETRLVQARALLAEAGYGPDHPLKLTYSHSTVGEMKRVAVAIAAMWKQIGVETTLSGSEGKVMFANLRQGNYEVAFAGWSADFNDPASFLYLLQSTSTASNYSRYQDPEYDALLDLAADTVNHLARAELLRQAEALMLADQPVLPLAVGVSKNLIAPQVHGWRPNAMDVHLSRYLSIDAALTR